MNMNKESSKDVELSRAAQSRMNANFSADESRQWHATLEAGVKAQKLIPGGVAVGGTAAALYAGHRLSVDSDHLLADLRGTFDTVLERLEDDTEWKTARVKRPVLILGSIGEAEVGFRQTRRSGIVEAVEIPTPTGLLTIPTLAELIAMKAFLAYSRNATRDYLDFAALTTCTEDETVIESLLGLDQAYGQLQTASIVLEVAKVLSAPAPADLGTTDLSRYKALSVEWQDWSKTDSICRRFGALLAQRAITE